MQTNAVGTVAAVIVTVPLVTDWVVSWSEVVKIKVRPSAETLSTVTVLLLLAVEPAISGTPEMVS